EAPAAPTPPPPPARRLDGQLAGYDRAQARMARWIEPPAETPAPLSEVLPGVERATASGPTWIVEERLPLTGVHGDRVLGDLFTRDCDHLQRVVGDERLAGFRPDQALFLDIEATGLDHGAGTVAFVIGLGFKDGDEVVVRQLCLREPSEERAMLLVLEEHLERFPFLVSFNGKSYDLTVLQNRLVMQRLYSRERSQLKLRPHLDLLHLSKNLYRGRWADTRLQTLEAEALGLVREDDIPGHLVPTCWFSWLRYRRAEPLAAVARHNRDDVLSMVTLAELLVGDTLPGAAATREPVVGMNLGRVLLRRGFFDEARRVADATIAGLEDPTHLATTHRVIADAARRLGDADARAEALEAVLQHTPSDDPTRRELTSLLARLGRHDAALVHADALERCGAGSTPPVRRLIERVRRHAARPSAPASAPT
ncbi:MAG: hypothetical protein EP329_06790, partial [Deltaproteobacteria bacterium]